MRDVTVVDHPLVQHKLSLMRQKETGTHRFRLLLREIALLLGYEVTRDLATESRNIETPLAQMRAPFLAGKKLALVSILRAGNGLLEGMIDLIPSARVGHVGLYRDPQTLAAVQYYFKVPEDLQDRVVILLDPMLATGNSGPSPRSTDSKIRTPAISRWPACWRRRKALRRSTQSTPKCRFSPPPSTSGSTTTATSFLGSETPATGCTAPGDPHPIVEK